MGTVTGMVQRLTVSAGVGTNAVGLSDVGLIVAALRSRCGHYIFVVWFLLLLLLSSFFPRLILAVAERISTIHAIHGVALKERKERVFIWRFFGHGGTLKALRHGSLSFT